MYGHGFGLHVPGRRLRRGAGRQEAPPGSRTSSTRAVKYTINAQSSRGGWYYTSKADGHDHDEGSVTITQVQALRAARNAGIPVPKEVIKKVTNT